MRPIPVLATLATVVVLAACSSGTPASSTTSTTTSSTTTSTSTSTTTTSTPASTTSSTTTSSTTTTVAAASTCTTAQLEVTASTGQGAAGTIVRRFVAKNTGSTACVVQGYPYVAPFGPQQQSGVTVEANLPAIKVGPIPEGFGDIGGSNHPLLQLAPGGTAAFFLKWSDVPSSVGTCYQVDGFGFAAQLASTAGEKLVNVSLGSVCSDELEESQMLSPSVTS